MSARRRQTFVPRTPHTPAAERLRLSAHASGRYLVDGNGDPFQIRGSSTWCIVNVNESTIDYVLDRTVANGFNSVVVMSALSENANAQYGPVQAGGLFPFTDSKLTPSEPFWAHLDYIIDQAAERGLVVQLAFLYLGHDSSADGFRSRVSGCTSGECQAFGEFLGARYASRPNLIWICGGDNQTNWTSNWDAMVSGILSEDSTHLMSGHPSRGQEGRAFGSFITLNSIYRNRAEMVSGSLAAYAGSPTLPAFMFEGVYAGDGTPWSNPTLTPAETRPQLWQTLLSGACGANHGNHEVWTCGYVNTSLVYPNWLDELDAADHAAMIHLAAFFDAGATGGGPIPWWTLVPDASNTFVMSGLSSNETRVAAARSADGRFGVVAIPAGGQVTVAMSQMSGTTTVRRFDPTSGAFAAVGIYANSGSQNIDPPLNAAGDADQILLFEAP